MSVITVTKANFASEVKSSAVPVMLDFWATWCGPCRMLSPLVDELAEETPGIKVGKVNVDEEPELATEFGITLIPTVIVMKNGKITAKSTGYKPKSELAALLAAE